MERAPQEDCPDDGAAGGPGGQKEAQAREHERDAKSEEADHLLHRHHGFAKSLAIFQVAIALGAVAALTRNRLVWFGSLLLGVAGAFFWPSRTSVRRISKLRGSACVNALAFRTSLA